MVLADADGHIAWTFMGKIPVRRGFDGSVSVSWADGRTGWNGFIAPDELPRIVDPPSGYLVSANHRMVGEEYPMSSVMPSQTATGPIASRNDCATRTASMRRIYWRCNWIRRPSCTNFIETL